MEMKRVEAVVAHASNALMLQNVQTLCLNYMVSISVYVPLTLHNFQSTKQI